MVAVRPARSRTTPARKVAHAHEVRDEASCAAGRRRRARRPQLDDPTRVHDRDEVRHREGLFLIVRHADERDADLAVHALELELHLLAELEVEGPERLVEEQDRAGWLTSARASATRCCWPPDSSWGRRRSRRAEPHLLERLSDGAPDLGGGPGPHPQPERDVLEDGQVRKQRVVLEDGVDVPPVRGSPSTRSTRIETDPPVWASKPATMRSVGGLPAAARAQEGDELPTRDVERHGIERDDFPNLFVTSRELEVRKVSPRGRLLVVFESSGCAKAPPRRDTSLGPVVGPRPHRDYTAALCGPHKALSPRDPREPGIDGTHAQDNGRRAGEIEQRRGRTSERRAPIEDEIDAIPESRDHLIGRRRARLPVGVRARSRHRLSERALTKRAGNRMAGQPDADRPQCRQ